MSTFPARLYPGDTGAAVALGVLAQITVVVLLAALAARALARRGAAVHHTVWLGGLGCVLISPLLALLASRAGLVLLLVPLSGHDPVPETVADGPWVEPMSMPALSGGPARTTGSRSKAASGEVSPQPKVPSGVLASVPPATALPGQEGPRESSQAEPPSPPRVGLWNAGLGGLFAVWGAGVLFLLLRLLHGCWVLAALSRSARPLDGACRRVLDQVRLALGTKSLPLIETSPEVAEPVAGGVFRPRVLLPEGLPETLNGQPLRDVLIHECAHLLRRDPFVGLLQRLAEALFWLHPLVHYLNRRLARSREEICDNYVLRHGDACAYARTLLALTEHGGAGCRPVAAAGLIDADWKLEGRVAGLLDPRRNLMTRMNTWTFATVVAVLLAAGVVVAGVHLQSEPVTQDKAPVDQPAKEPTKEVSRARIEGVVVDEKGKPVGGAVIGVLRHGPDAGPGTVRSSPDGSFRLVLDGPSARYHTVVATADGGARQGIFHFQDTVLSIKAEARIVLKPSRDLTVRVRNADKKPVAAAAVGVFDHLSAGVLASTVTNEGGLASLRLPRDAAINQVVALKADVGFDYFENYRSFPGSVLGTLPAQVSLTLDGARTITAQAIDSSGKALPNIDLIPWSVQKKGKLSYVNLGGAAEVKYVQSRTDRQGLAVFTWIPRNLQDPVTILQRGEDYHLPEAPHYDTALPDKPLIARLLRNVPISGKVTLPDGKPAAGILLQVEGRGATNFYYRNVVRTGADGSYQLRVYPDQSYLVAITDDQWAAPSKSGIVVREGEPQKDLDFRLSKGTLIQGKVTVGRDRKPVAGQTMTLIEHSRDNPDGNAEERQALVRWATTGKDGRYAIRVGSGVYEIRGPGRDRPEPLEVKAEKTITKDFHADRLPRGRITGVVLARTADGQPVAGAIVKGESIGEPGHAGFEAVADDRGRFQSERWRDKAHLYARNPKGTLATIATIGAEDEEVKILLVEAGQFKGRLVGKDGKPVAGVRVLCGLHIGPEANPNARASLYTETDENGSFTFPGIVPGSQCTVMAFTTTATETLKQLPLERAATIDLGDLVFDPVQK